MAAMLPAGDQLRIDGHGGDKIDMLVHHASPSMSVGHDADQDDKRSQVREEWSDEATDAVLDIWAEKHISLNRGKLKKHEWDEVAVKVTHVLGGGKNTKSWLQCKNKIDSIKKKYKAVRSQRAAGAVKKEWRLFDKVDYLLGAMGQGGTSDGIRHFPSGPDDSDDDDDDDDEAEGAEPVEVPKPRAFAAPELEVVKLMGNSFKGSVQMNGVAKPGIRKKKGFNAFKDLALAVREFAAVYDRVEKAKLEKLVEIENKRMEFTKEVEMQRMQVQLEIARHGGRTGGPSNPM